MEAAYGKDLSWFFNEWIFGRGWPVYALGSRWSPDTLSVTIYQQQPAGFWQAYKMPVQLRVYGGGDELPVTVWDSLRTQSFRIHLPFTPDSIRLDPDGWILHQNGVPQGVEDGMRPASFGLEQNYPNPFNPSSDIRYQISEFRMVRLSVYDLLGREVAVLVNESKPAGVYTARFDGMGLASGMYFYRLAAYPARGAPGSGFVRTRKMILAK
jgi:hypothetical protein